MENTSLPAALVTAVLLAIALAPVASAAPPDDCVYDDGHGTKFLCVRLVQVTGTVMTYSPVVSDTYLGQLLWYKVCSDSTCDAQVTIPIVWPNPSINFCQTISLPCSHNPIGPEPQLYAPIVDNGVGLFCRAEYIFEFDADADGNNDFVIPTEGELVGLCASFIL